MAEQKETPESEMESSRRLAERVANLTGVAGGPSENKHEPEQSYIGGGIHEEDMYPEGTSEQMRRRGNEKPLGRRVGYYEEGERGEEGTDDWMTGEASQVSGGGVRGSRNWCLKVAFPILLVVGIVCMHNWWVELRTGLLTVVHKTGDILDRRLEADATPKHEHLGDGEFHDKAVHKLKLEKGDEDATDI